MPLSIRVFLANLLLGASALTWAQSPTSYLGEASTGTEVADQVFTPDGTLLVAAYERGRGVVLRALATDGRVAAELDSLPAASEDVLISVADNGVVRLLSQASSLPYRGVGVVRVVVEPDLSQVRSVSIDTLLAGRDADQFVNRVHLTRRQRYAAIVRDSVWQLVRYDYATGRYDSAAVHAQTSGRPSVSFVYGDSVYFYSRDPTVYSQQGHAGNYYAYPADGSAYYPQVFPPGSVFRGSRRYASAGEAREQPYTYEPHAPPVGSGAIVALSVCFPRRDCRIVSFPPDIEGVYAPVVSRRDGPAVYLAQADDSDGSLHLLRELSPGTFARTSILAPPGSLSAPGHLSALFSHGAIGSSPARYAYAVAERQVDSVGLLTGPMLGSQPTTVPRFFTDGLIERNERPRGVHWLSPNLLYVFDDAGGYLVDAATREVLRRDSLPGVASATGRLSAAYASVRPTARSVAVGYHRTETGPDLVGLYTVDSAGVQSREYPVPDDFLWGRRSFVATSGGGVGLLSNTPAGEYELAFWPAGSSDGVAPTFRTTGGVPVYSAAVTLELSDVIDYGGGYAAAMVQFEDPNTCTGIVLRAGVPALKLFSRWGSEMAYVPLVRNAASGTGVLDSADLLIRGSGYPRLRTPDRSTGVTVRMVTEQASDLYYDIDFSGSGAILGAYADAHPNQHTLVTPEGYVLIPNHAPSQQLIFFARDWASPRYVETRRQPVDTLRPDAVAYDLLAASGDLAAVGAEAVYESAWSIGRPPLADQQTWLRAPQRATSAESPDPPERALRWTAYPNPTADYITLQPPRRVPGVYGSRVRVVDADGQTVLSAPWNGNGATVRLDVRELPAGVYLARVGTASVRFVRTDPSTQSSAVGLGSSSLARLAPKPARGAVHDRPKTAPGKGEMRLATPLTHAITNKKSSTSTVSRIRTYLAKRDMAAVRSVGESTR